MLPQTPNDHPNMRSLLIRLANAHDKRFDLLREPGDIQKAIKYRAIVLTLVPDDGGGGDVDLLNLLNALGTAHGKRYQHLGEKNDIGKAIEYLSLALELIPEGHLDLPYQLANLGLFHAYQFEHLGKQEDIEKAIEFQSRAVAVTPIEDPRWPELVERLGSLHLHRFQQLGEVKNLEHAIDYQSRALDLTPDDHPDFPRRLANLAVSQGDRFKRLGDLNDLEQAIKHETQALALTPENHPLFPSRLSNLAVSHKYRFERLGKLNDLEQAIKHQTRALALTPDDHPLLSRRLANLAVSHSNRFERLGELSDLEQAIKHETQALALTPDDHPELSSRLANLAVSHSNRFRRLGNLSDLEQAIKHGTHSLALTPDDHSQLALRLASLAVSHGTRFKRLGELGDLEYTIKYETRALALTPDDHPQLSVRLTNLAVSHRYRFERLGELEDLEQAIKHDMRALTLTPNDHPHLSIHLMSLAASHSDRFRHLGELSDLEQAIKHGAHALALIPDDHPDFSISLAHLAVFYSHRFRRLGELSDLQQAIEYESRALVAIPPDHPDSCHWYFNHAISQLDYYNHDQNPSHLQQSLTLFRSACTSLAGAPRDKFRSAHEWASRASKHDMLNPVEAYQVTIDLLPQFIWLGATADQRYQDLESVESLAVDAAHAAIASSNYSLALEWLEHGRCIVWNQNLMLRSPLDHLLASHPTLATRLQTVSAELHTASSNPRELYALSRLTSPEQAAQDHRRLAKEYEDLLAQARIQPGFEDFLQPVKTNQLMHAACNGPVIVINCHDARCDALLVLPQKPNVTHVPLPKFSSDKAKAARLELQLSVESMRLRERGAERRPIIKAGEEPGFAIGSILAVLWNDVVKPILDHLGYTKNTSTDNLPHITWCPTGAMTFLPLHAAGDYDQPRSRVFDYAISSYTPTLNTLLEATPYSINQDSRVLAVGQTATPGHARLPGTAIELESMKAHMGDKVGYTQLIDEQATTNAVLDAMEQHDWVHLACHAHQNVNDPKKSGFFLSDGVLDLDGINQRSFKGKGLAFLSACQTATGDEALPDEAVHLASGMLMAGYSSVIATMWSVSDADAPFVADQVYGQLMKKGTLENGEAGRALHDAVAGLRERVGEKQFGRWVPYIHIGS
ncbi:unnamed protein product [Rhizoctonia solani]|uniref:CHAT domain-containing protein n=1 Tax=Rhizoctonia solani TaxID=456999 RepID=A0A8H3DXC3_9AGAM|nr:unnamed protein product [Rhizoctonia solani]